MYRASVEGRAAAGRIIKTKKAFFPDDWTRDEVRETVRDAFANREQVRDAKGNVRPTLWEGEFHGIRIRDYLPRVLTFTRRTRTTSGNHIPSCNERQTPPALYEARRLVTPVRRRVGGWLVSGGGTGAVVVVVDVSPVEGIGAVLPAGRASSVTRLSMIWRCSTSCSTVSVPLIPCP